MGTIGTVGAVSIGRDSDIGSVGTISTMGVVSIGRDSDIGSVGTIGTVGAVSVVEIATLVVRGLSVLWVR